MVLFKVVEVVFGVFSYKQLYNMPPITLASVMVEDNIQKWNLLKEILLVSLAISLLVFKIGNLSSLIILNVCHRLDS